MKLKGVILFFALTSAVYLTSAQGSDTSKYPLKQWGQPVKKPLGDTNIRSVNSKQISSEVLHDAANLRPVINGVADMEYRLRRYRPPVDWNRRPDLILCGRSVESYLKNDELKEHEYFGTSLKLRFKFSYGGNSSAYHSTGTGSWAIQITDYGPSGNVNGLLFSGILTSGQINYLSVTKNDSFELKGTTTWLAECLGHNQAENISRQPNGTNTNDYDIVIKGKSGSIELLTKEEKAMLTKNRPGEGAEGLLNAGVKFTITHRATGQVYASGIFRRAVDIKSGTDYLSSVNNNLNTMVR